jgi:diadenosine tetraphosphate (Ap4A) HIT family hydrolase
MTKDTSCAYCMEGDLVAKFGYPCCTLDTCTVYVFKEQSKKGRCICAYKNHVSEMVDLTDEERNAFFADVAKVAKALHKAFAPDKVNYGAYGDTGGHLHFHLCPKYKGGDEWGGTFTMNSGKVLLSDAEYEAIAQAIRNNL